MPSWMDLARPGCLDHASLHDMFFLVAVTMTDTATRAGLVSLDHWMTNYSTEYKTSAHNRPLSHPRIVGIGVLVKALQRISLVICTDVSNGVAD